MDELLAKGVIEPSDSGAGFYSSVFVVPKHTGGLQPICNHKHFHCYLHIPSFKMPPIRHVQQLIQSGDYAFFIDHQDAYLHICIVKHHRHFYDLFGTIHHISGKFYLFGWSQPLGFSQPSLNLSCSFAITRVSILWSVWITSWSWACSKKAANRVHSFLCFLLVCLGWHINFFQVLLPPYSNVLFLGLCWDTVHM